MTGQHIAHLALVDHLDQLRADPAHADRPQLPERPASRPVRDRLRAFFTRTPRPAQPDRPVTEPRVVTAG